MTDIELSRIPAGSVTLHDARRGTRRTVELDTFEIGVYPVTQEQLAEIIGVPAQHPRRPASDLSWLRAVRLCNAASEWEGLDPAYTFDGEEVTWHVDSDGYRLPTEAEWEYAARLQESAPGTTASGPPPNLADTETWHPRAAGAATNGLRQLFGDCWEWTSSAYLPYPGFHPTSGALGEYNGKFMSSQMVLRGGCALTPPGHARVSYRNFFPPGARWPLTGVRLADDGAPR